jgi:DNA repair protein RadC
MIPSMPAVTMSDRPLLQQKLHNFGRSALTDAELLALLIGKGHNGRSALDIARDLLANVDDDLKCLGQKSLEEFKGTSGIGEASAFTLLAAFEIGRRRSTAVPQKQATIRSASSAHEQLKGELEDLTHEEFWVMYLNSGSRLIAKKRISSGGLSGTVADVRLILKWALDLRATAMIAGHNHPSGNLKPSEPDIRLTRKLKEASEWMDIRLLDHLIFADKGYFSFADEGLVF